MIGLSRRSINAYLKTHAELAEEVKVERLRHKTVAHHAPRMVPASGGPADDVVDAGFDYANPAPVSQVDREKLLGLLFMHASDPDSRGCAKALGILSDLGFTLELLRMRTEAKRLELESSSGASNRPLVVRIPPSTLQPRSNESGQTPGIDGASYSEAVIDV